MAKDELITITQAYYDSLLINSNLLAALTDAGVDNWEGYDSAMDSIIGYETFDE